MSNVAKLKKKAAEFELKRQFDKALAIYIELLDDFDSHVDELDVALFNRVGDMLLRQGNVADAVDYYERAVDRYADGGFFNNAIALCNKILRQSPGRTSVYYKLGKISAQKGFKSDAKQNFLEYADRMQKSGRIDEAFRALKEFADLCPDQDDIRLMLAEQLSRQSRNGEAIEQLQTLFDRYTGEGRDTEARATLDRIRAIDPAYEPRVTGQQVAQKGSDLVFLDVYADDEPHRNTPPDPLAGLPIQSFDDEPAPVAPTPLPIEPAAPQPPPPQPEPAAGMMLDLQPTSFGGYDAAPPATHGRATLDGLETTSFEPASFEPAGVEPVSHEPPGIEPPVAAAPPADDLIDVVGVDFVVPDEVPDRIQPGTEASVPEITLSAAEAFEDLPLMDLEVPGPGPAAPTPTLRPTGDIPLISGMDGTRDQQAAFADAWAAGAEDTTLVSFPGDALDLRGLAPLDLTPAEPAVPEPARPEPARPESAVPEPEPIVDVSVDRTRSATIAAEQSVERLERALFANPDDLALRRQLAEARLEAGDREGGISDLDAVMVALERAEDLIGAASIADEIARLTPAAVKIHQKRVEYAFRTNDRSRLVGAYLDLAAALLGDGQTDKARTVYKRVLDLAPDDIAAQAGLAALATPPGAAPAVPATPAAAPPRPTPSQGLFWTGAQPTVRRDEVRAAPPKPLPGAPANADSFVNLGDMLRDEEAPRSTRMVVDEKEPTGDEEADFAEMLRKFKQGVAENVDAEDHQAHYDLGVAFKEMGLVDEAIAEFQKALRAPSNRLPTYEALGQCFVEKGQYQVATAILTRAVAEQTVPDEQLIGVLYLLGVAAEALGKPQDAMNYFQRVFVVDIQFRDVADRLASLEQVRR